MPESMFIPMYQGYQGNEMVIESY